MRRIAYKMKHGLLVAGVGLALGVSAASAQADPCSRALELWHGAAADAHSQGLALGAPAGSDTGHRVS